MGGWGIFWREFVVFLPEDPVFPDLNYPWIGSFLLWMFFFFFLNFFGNVDLITRKSIRKRTCDRRELERNPNYSLK